MGFKRYVCPGLNESAHNRIDRIRVSPIYLTDHKRKSLVGPERKWVETKIPRRFSLARYQAPPLLKNDEDDAASLVPCRKAFEGRLRRSRRRCDRRRPRGLHRFGSP